MSPPAPREAPQLAGGGFYEERRPPSVAAHLACLWVDDGAAASVLPDGCVDVVLSAGRLEVAGPATVAVEVAATPGQPRCGVRFRTGLAGAALGVPADQLRDLTVPLAELWGAAGRRLSGRVANAPTIEMALDRLTAGLARPYAPLDPGVRHAALLTTARPLARVAGELGYSERQLRRRIERAVGYGPRTLTRILRLQRFLRLATADSQGSLARLAVDAGYADHAHLDRESRRLTGRTPSALLRAGATAAGEPVSETFKPPAQRDATLDA